MENLLTWGKQSVVAVSLPVMQPLLRQVIYRKDGSSRITMTPKTRRSDQDQNNGGRGSISLLTFGRSGMKGPSGRSPHGLDVTTIATVATTDANFDSSVTRLAPGDQCIRNTENTKLEEGYQKFHV